MLDLLVEIEQIRRGHLGFHAAGQVRDRCVLPSALAAAAAAARSGQCVLVDVRVRPVE